MTLLEALGLILYSCIIFLLIGALMIVVWALLVEFLRARPEREPVWTEVHHYGCEERRHG